AADDQFDQADGESDRRQQVYALVQLVEGLRRELVVRQSLPVPQLLPILPKGSCRRFLFDQRRTDKAWNVPLRGLCGKCRPSMHATTVSTGRYGTSFSREEGHHRCERRHLVTRTAALAFRSRIPLFSSAVVPGRIPASTSGPGHAAPTRGVPLLSRSSPRQASGRPWSGAPPEPTAEDRSSWRCPPAPDGEVANRDCSLPRRWQRAGRGGYPRGVATHRRDARAASFANNASSRLRKWPEKWPENALWGISGHFGSGSLSWGGSSRRVRLGRASRPYRPHITEFETGLPSTTVTGSYSAAAQSGTVGRCCLRCRETAGQPLTFPTSPPPRRLRLLVPP